MTEQETTDPTTAHGAEGPGAEANEESVADATQPDVPQPDVPQPDDTAAGDAVVQISGGEGQGGELGPESANAEATDVDVVDSTQGEVGEGPAPAPPVDSPWTRPGKWFVLHTQSGYENKVRQNLEARTSSMNMEHRIYEVVIPMEDVVEYKQGKKVVVQKKMFPGYLLVRCRLDDDSWYVIRNTPGVTGFVGAGNKPSPLPRRDVETFLTVKTDDDEQAPKRQRPRLAYDINETVRVKEGPFADFSGEIVEINEDQLKLKVLVDIFGRETPVELEFSQVAKL